MRSLTYLPPDELRALLARRESILERQEQSQVEAALFTARTDEERRFMLDLLATRERNRAAKVYS